MPPLATMAANTPFRLLEERVTLSNKVSMELSIYVQVEELVGIAKYAVTIQEVVFPGGEDKLVVVDIEAGNHIDVGP